MQEEGALAGQDGTHHKAGQGWIPGRARPRGGQVHRASRENDSAWGAQGTGVATARVGPQWEAGEA